MLPLGTLILAGLCLASAQTLTPGTPIAHIHPFADAFLDLISEYSRVGYNQATWQDPRFWDPAAAVHHTQDQYLALAAELEALVGVSMRQMLGLPKEDEEEDDHHHRHPGRVHVYERLESALSSLLHPHGGHANSSDEDAALTTLRNTLPTDLGRSWFSTTWLLFFRPVVAVMNVPVANAEYYDRWRREEGEEEEGEGEGEGYDNNNVMLVEAMQQVLSIPYQRHLFGQALGTGLVSQLDAWLRAWETVRALVEDELLPLSTAVSAGFSEALSSTVSVSSPPVVEQHQQPQQQPVWWWSASTMTWRSLCGLSLQDDGGGDDDDNHDDDGTGAAAVALQLESDSRARLARVSRLMESRAEVARRVAKLRDGVVELDVRWKDLWHCGREVVSALTSSSSSPSPSSSSSRIPWCGGFTRIDEVLVAGQEEEGAEEQEYYYYDYTLPPPLEIADVIHDAAFLSCRAGMFNPDIACRYDSLRMPPVPSYAEWANKTRDRRREQRFDEAIEAEERQLELQMMLEQQEQDLEQREQGRGRVGSAWVAGTVVLVYVFVIWSQARFG